MSAMPLSPEDAPVEPAGSDQAKKVLLVVAGVALLALIGWGLSRIKFSDGGSRPKQQTVKITLPDTPPPPPPKPEEKRPEPKQDNKPQQQQEQKQAPISPPQTKIDEAASNNGSSNLPPSGHVDKDGGIPSGGTGGTGIPSADDRRKAMLYVNNIRRLLKEELERKLDTEERQLVVSVALWIAPDGHLSKFELQPSGNARADADAQHAFEEVSKSVRLDKPGDVIQPLRMKLTLLPSGQ